MNIFHVVLGVLLLLLAILDFLWTTLWVDGSAGPLSSRMGTWLWRIVRRLNARRSRTLSLAGPFILMSTLLAWIGLLWLGWTFVFAGGNAITASNNQEPVTSWVAYMYFAAYTLFTLGIGDFVPRAGIWQIVTSLATGSGMLFITLGVSYVLSVLSAVNQKRAFASSVTGLGTGSEALVRSGWNGVDLHSLDLPLNSLTAQVTTLTEQHKAYPILHYYHSEKAQNASAMAVAILDEALTLLCFGIPVAHRPNIAIIESARSSIQNYLQLLLDGFIDAGAQPPPPPDLNCLRTAGIPTVDDETFAQAIGQLTERRRKLHSMVEADAWYWPPIKV